MPLQAGQLRERVTVQAVDTIPDDAGGQKKSWSDVVTLWARIEPLNGGEAFRQGILNATQFYRVTIRMRAGVSPRNRLVWRGTPLNIRTCADPDGTREALVMTVESGAGEP